MLYARNGHTNISRRIYLYLLSLDCRLYVLVILAAGSLIVGGRWPCG